MQSAVDRDAIAKQVWRIIDRLQHRAAIVEGDARHWVQEVVGRYGELAVWHATRAGGFGGSQIGALVRNHGGQRADHGASAHDIVELTLLRRLPDEPNGQMERGVWFEPHHREFFYRKWTAARDEGGFQSLSKGVGPRPWMRYSPDDLVYMRALGERSAKGGKPLRVLIDFKAPTAVDQKERVSFQYVCQLHMGRLVCVHNGVEVDCMLLSQLDYANWQLKDDEIPYFAQLDEAIIAAGDHYWQYVLRGEVPPYVRKNKLDAQAFGPEVQELAQKLARLKALRGAFETQADAVEAVLKPLLEKIQFGTSALQLSGIKYTAVPKPDTDLIRSLVPEEVLAAVPLQKNRNRYDADAMERKLREMGANMRDFVQPQNMDADALYAALCDAGLDAESLMKEQLRGAVDKDLVSDAAAWVRREFPDLILQPQSEAEAPSGAGEQNDRDGHETQRCVPRSVVA